MNNERIDLTQFEGLFEPNLLLHVFEEFKKVGFKDQTTVWAAKKPPIYFGKQTVDAIEMLPDLIAELKRCYEELDEANKEGEALWNVLDNWDICMDDYSMHDLYNNLDEKYARDDEGRIILKELYSYTEEDGWQPKETASQ